VAGVGTVSDLNFALLPAGPSPAEVGNFDGDGDVDGFDFLKWQRSFGGNGSTGADANGDNIVNGGDLAVWRTNFGTTGLGLAASAASSVSSMTASISAVSDTGLALGSGWIANDRAFAEAVAPPALGRQYRPLLRPPIDESTFAESLETNVLPAALASTGLAVMAERDPHEVQVCDDDSLHLDDVDGVFSRLSDAPGTVWRGI
jgi:hypothetical protein